MTTATISPASQSISPVPFHGQTLFVVEKDGQPFVPMRPVVEGMGLAWKPQFSKIKARGERFCVTMMVTQMPGDDQTREVVCLPLRKLPGWLMTINPSKVAPSLRSNVVVYQNECDDALWDFWTKGQATNKRIMPEAKPEPELPCAETVKIPISRQVLSEDVRQGVALIAAKRGSEGSAYLDRKRYYQLAACNVGAGNATRMTNNEVAKVLPLVRQQIEGALGEKIDWREISADGRFVIERLVVTAPTGTSRPVTKSTRPEPEQVRLDPIDNTVKDLIDEVIESLHRTGKNNDEYLYGIERDVESLVKTMTAKISTADLPAMERRATLELLAETARAFREQTHLMMIARNAISPILRTMTHIAWIADSRRSIQDAKVALPAGRGRPRKALTV